MKIQILKKVATICTVANSLRIPFDFYPDEVNASQIQKFLESIQDENAYEVLSMVSFAFYAEGSL